MRSGRWTLKVKVPGSPGRRRGLIACVAAGLFVWVVFGGNKGLVALVSSWQEKRLLEQEIVSLKESNKQLALDKRRLEKDPQQYEKVAREKLMLANPGELIYRFDPGEGG